MDEVRSLKCSRCGEAFSAGDTIVVVLHKVFTMEPKSHSKCLCTLCAIKHLVHKEVEYAVRP